MQENLPEVCVDMSTEWHAWYTYKKMISYQESIAYAFVGCNADWVLAHPDFGCIWRRLVDEAMENEGMFDVMSGSELMSGSDSDYSNF